MSHKLTAEIHFLSKRKKDRLLKEGLKENLLFLIQKIILEVIRSETFQP